MIDTVCDMAELALELASDEGRRRRRYRCTERKLTIGIGHNLEGKRFRPGTWAAIVAEHPHIRNALLDEVLELSDELIDRILADDVEDAIADLDAIWVGWRELSERRRRALINLSFQMGRVRLLTFRRFWAALKAGNYDAAADELIDSDWFHQTQASRTERVIRFVREG